MKGKSTRLRSAAGVQLWHRSQRPLQDLQLWRALTQRLLDITATLPDLPSIHTFLPQIEVTTVLPGWLTGGAASQAHHFSHSARETNVFSLYFLSCRAWPFLLGVLWTLFPSCSEGRWSFFLRHSSGTPKMNFTCAANLNLGQTLSHIPLISDENPSSHCHEIWSPIDRSFN